MPQEDYQKHFEDLIDWLEAPVTNFDIRTSET